MKNQQKETLAFPEEHYYKLRADCKNCFGLCCVALYFSTLDGFPEDKEAGQPCRNLQPDFRCCTHASLKKMGLKGCLAFDCFGAGPKVAQIVFGGRNWQTHKEIASQIFAVFLVMRQLHELLWYLTEALSLQVTRPIHGELQVLLEEIEQLTLLSSDLLLNLDVAKHREKVNTLLQKTSELVRCAARQRKQPPSGQRRTYGPRAMLIAADLRKADLRGANLRGACMIAADLRGVDLTGTDLIGADFRDADIRGTDLAGSLFLSQAQVNAAKGDLSTQLPWMLIRPAHWQLA